MSTKRERRINGNNGYGTPGDIFTALENGVDVFDSSCVYSATERGCAVVFPLEHQACSHQVGRSEGEGEEEGKANSDVDDRTELRPFEIDLNEER